MAPFFTGKTINAIAILEMFLSSREFAYCENLILELWSSIFRPENQNALSLFLKFLLGHFIFGYKDEFLSNRSDF